jgi:glycolate dehydrogenase FAD-linked subunit
VEAIVADLQALLAAAVGAGHVLAASGIPADYGHDEALDVAPVQPAFLVRPGSTAEVAAVLRVASEQRVGVTARGSGTGLAGAARPGPGGVLVSFERMNRVLEIDDANNVAVVQPGVTLAELDRAAAGQGLVYPVFPGEMTASLGGTIATNAGGMRAVKYGVTRNHVLGLEAVLASGEVLRSGGKHVKVSSGYDLTQLLIGSEGTLALVTEAVVRLYPRLSFQATVLAPFASLEQVTAAVPRIIATGIGPLICEYVDVLTMAAITADGDIDLGIPAGVRESAIAYLVVMLEERTQDRLDDGVAELADQLTRLGAADVYVPAAPAARRLVEAREKAFWSAKGAGAHDILDAVVPRAAMAAFFDDVTRATAGSGGALVAGCGHAGDGNVHLAVFQPDAAARDRLLREIFAAAAARGGAVSGEHGIGVAKKQYFLELADPVAVALMRRVKQAFDPRGILGPGVLFDSPVAAGGTE